MNSSNIPSETEMTNLVHNWFAAANEKSGTTKRVELYQATKKIVTSLNALDSQQNAESQEKVAILCLAVIKAFKSHNINDSEQLASWVASNTSLKPGSATVLKGAYQSLHHLLISVDAAAKKCPSIFNPPIETDEEYEAAINQLEALQNLKHIDNAALDYIEAGKRDFSTVTEGQELIYSKMNLKDLLAIHATSHENRAIANKVLVKHLNEGKVTLQDLGIKKDSNLIETIQDFFGESCSEILELDLTLDRLPDASIFQSPPRLEYIDLKFLKKFPKLQSLNIPFCEKIVNFKFLNYCSNLQNLDISNCKDITSKDILQHCKKCKKLKNLSLRGCIKITDTEFLRNFENLESLNLETCFLLKTISHVKFCPNLKSLNLSHCDLITNFSSLKSCKLIQNLQLVQCKKFNTEILQHFKNLKILNLSYCEITDTKFLEYCTTLQSLNMSHCYLVTKISHLENCQNLEFIDLTDCKKMSDIGELETLKKLQKVNLSKCRQVSLAQAEALLNEGVKLIY